MRVLVALAAAVAAASAATAVYGDAQIVVSGGAGAGGVVSRLKATHPRPATGTGAAAAGQFVTVTFDVSSKGDGAALAPHQAFVRFTSESTGAVTHFVAAPDAAADKPGTHKLKLDLSDRKGLAGLAEGGKYAVDLVIADADIDNPTQWRIASSLELTPAAAPAKPAPILYTQPLLHESDTALAPLKEIQHQFRAPERRPPAVVSYAASAAIVAAAGVWLVYVLTSVRGVALSLPLSALPAAMVFYPLLAAILGLFALYWLQLTMFTTLAYLAPLAAAAAFFGRQTLVAVAAAADKRAA